MSENKNEIEVGAILLKKMEELEERMDIIHGSLKELNGAIDMLVRFSMTSKAFMEIAIAQGLIDPLELNRVAAIYEEGYSANIGTTDVSKSNMKSFG